MLLTTALNKFSISNRWEHATETFPPSVVFKPVHHRILFVALSYCLLKLSSHECGLWRLLPLPSNSVDTEPTKLKKNVCKVNMHQIVVKSGLFWSLSLLWEVAAESKFIGSAFLSMVL